MKSSIAILLFAAATQCVHIANAQVVQLPSMGSSSYSGSVMVPDRGSTYLYGHTTNQAYASEFGGVPRSRSLGSRGTAGNASVHAHIIDLDEIDRIIRGDSQEGVISGNPKIPSMATRRVVGGVSKPVAAIYSSPLPGETPKSKTGRIRRMSDFTPGDYMMLLSHPGLVDQAHTENDQAIAKRRAEMNVPMSSSKSR